MGYIWNGIIFELMVMFFVWLLIFVCNESMLWIINIDCWYDFDLNIIGVDEVFIYINGLVNFNVISKWYFIV